MDMHSSIPGGVDATLAGASRSLLSTLSELRRVLKDVRGRVERSDESTKALQQELRWVMCWVEWGVKREKQDSSEDAKATGGRSNMTRVLQK